MASLDGHEFEQASGGGDGQGGLAGCNPYIPDLSGSAFVTHDTVFGL